MSEPVTDSVLVQRAGRGDSIAFSELVNRHYRRALRVAFGLLRHAEHADEVIVEAFAQLHGRLPEFAGASAFYTWLYRIVVTLSGERRARSRPEGSGWARSAQMSEGEAQRLEVGEQLDRLLGGLPFLSQAILMLREMEGFSYDEIAATLQVKKGTVVHRLLEARLAVRRGLSPESEGEKKLAPEGIP